ncbi:MAG TPA: hypothetical protein VH416_03885 [Gaiellaceae bacterium]
MLLGVVLCVAALVAPAAGAADAHGARSRPVVPQVARIAVGPAAVPDAALSPSRARTVLASSSWGGQYTTASGETVTILVSDSYPQDQTLPQQWANFLGSLVHGPELSKLTMFLAPAAEVEGTCGEGALACYSAADSTLVAPAEDPSPEFSAEAVVTHEYGHHVAANRSDAPWRALDYGTKRWASYEQVCSGAQTGKFFPGAESQPNYQLNPGEAFAETFRVLNERTAGLTEPPWQVVSQSLYPDDAALAAVQQDVTAPWLGATVFTRTGSVAKTKSRTFTVATPLDGTLRASVRGTAGSRLAVRVLRGTTLLAHGLGGRSATASATICGQRAVRIKVTRLAGSGAFKLAIAKP